MEVAAREAKTGAALRTATHTATIDPGAVLLLSALIDTAGCGRKGMKQLSGNSLRDATHVAWRTKVGAARMLATAGLRFAASVLSNVSARYSSEVAWNAYVRAFAATHIILLLEKMKPYWARSAFEASRCRQMVPSRFFASLTVGSLDAGNLGEPATIVYGDAKFGASQRGRQSVPTTALYRSCEVTAGSCRARNGGSGSAVQTPEWRSTLTHSACGEVLAGVRGFVRPPNARSRAAGGGDAGEPKWRVIRGLKYCRNQGCSEPHARMVHRDGNPLRNIRANAVNLARGIPLPAHLRRGGHHVRGVQPEDFILTPE